MIIDNRNAPPSSMSFITDEQASYLLLQNMDDSCVLVDPQLSVVYFNRAAKEGVRRFLKIELVKGMHVQELTAPERIPIIQPLYAEVLKGNRYITENNFVQPGGEILYFENNILPAYNEAGEITGIIILSKNVTERKKAQQNIQVSEERLQFALEATLQGAWDWNLNTNEVIYSASYKKLYGFDENDLKNDVSEWITRIHPEDQEKMKFSVNDHLKSPNPVYESQYRIRAKDGSYRWVSAKGRLIRDEMTGEPLRMIGTHRDITDAIEQETKLKEFNDRFNCIMKATNELLWEWDFVSNQIFRPEDGLKKVYGIADNHSIAEIDHLLERIHPDDKNTIKKLVKNIVKAAHNETFEIEYRILSDAGEYNYIYDRGIVLRDEKDRIVRIIGSAQNISERKRLEKELLQAELEYQRLIHQATIDSQEKERAEIGKELHDNINQVLTTTKLYLDLAQSNKELREDLIWKSQKNINGVIQEIRHLSRSLMDPSIGDLGLLASIHDLVENIHLTKKLEVLLTADEAVEEMLDANQKLALFRIFQESLNNVLRHANATLVTINLFVENGQLHVYFHDNGVGFHPETVRKGAGLKNIHNRIYLINGTLHMESKPGEGCTIRIQFPI